MSGKLQILRTTDPTKGPPTNHTDGSQVLAGELYVNLANQQLGVIDDSNAGKNLIAVRHHSSRAVYAKGDLVVAMSVSGLVEIYQANADITTPGPFAAQASSWDLYTAGSIVSLPEAGDSQTITAADPADTPLKLVPAPAQTAEQFVVGTSYQINADGSQEALSSRNVAAAGDPWAYNFRSGTAPAVTNIVLGSFDDTPAIGGHVGNTSYNLLINPTDEDARVGVGRNINLTAKLQIDVENPLVTGVKINPAGGQIENLIEAEKFTVDKSGSVVSTYGDIVDNKDVTASAAGSTINIDVGSAQIVQVTYGQNHTLGFGGVPADGYSFLLLLTAAANNLVITWPGSVKWSRGREPRLPKQGETTLISFITADKGNNWFGIVVGESMS